jgi:hypothetical protein
VPADRTDMLGPYVGIPTVMSVSVSPYVRMRGQVAAQPEYSGVAKFIFGGLFGAHRNVHVAVTAGYLGGTPTTWDVAIPDLSGTQGFQTNWMPTPGQAPYYEVDLYSSVQAFGRFFAGLPLFPVRPKAGDVLKHSGRAAPVGAGAAQQAITQARLEPLSYHRPPGIQ